MKRIPVIKSHAELPSIVNLDNPRKKRKRGRYMDVFKSVDLDDALSSQHPTFFKEDPFSNAGRMLPRLET